MRRASVTAAIVALILLVVRGASASTAIDPAPSNPAAPVSDRSGGVVSSTPSTLRLLATGMDRSPTLAGIVQQLQTSNVLVTVEPLYRIKPGLSGYMVFVTRTMFRRYVRVYIDGRLYRDQQIAILAHELRHALEVAGHPEVVNEATLRQMYQAIGRHQTTRCDEGERWDSEAAIQTGRIVLKELDTPTASAAAGGR